MLENIKQDLIISDLAFYCVLLFLLAVLFCFSTKLAYQKVSTQSTDISIKEFLSLNMLVIRKEVSQSRMIRSLQSSTDTMKSLKKEVAAEAQFVSHRRQHTVLFGKLC